MRWASESVAMTPKRSPQKAANRRQPVPPERALARRTAAASKAASDAEKKRLFDALSKLSTLELVRVFLERLSEDVPIPGPGANETALVMSLLGHRAKSLYANYMFSRDSPAQIGPVLAVRPLVELAILAKWISLNPELHVFLYIADSDAAELVHIDAVRQHAVVRGHPVVETAETALQEAQKESVRVAALAKLKALKINYGKGQIMPNLRRMTDDVIAKEPGWKIAMNDAYVYAYKTFSPWEHTDASSFKATAEETVAPDWEWKGDRSPWHPADVEAIASATFAMILEIAFGTIGDAESARFARLIRDHIFKTYVRPDAVQPPSDKPDPVIEA